MSRFVFFTSLPTVGGHTTITLSMAQLIREGFDEVLVISREIPGHGTSIDAVESLQAMGVEIIVLRGRLLSSLYEIFTETKRRWRQPDLFFAMGMRHLSPALSLYLQPKKSIYYHITHELTPGIRKMLALYGLVFDEIVFISPATELLWAQEARSRISTRAICQPGGRLADVVCTAPRTGPMTFGFIGRLSAAKGCQVLIEFAKTTNVPCSLRVAGGGELASAFDLLSQDKTLPVPVQFDGAYSAKGRDEYLRSFFSEIDYLVVPSQDDREGIPTVILESLRAGVPVIATRTGGIRAFEIPAFGAKHGIPVRLTEKHEVAETLESIVNKGRVPNMAKLCQEFFQIRFSDEAVSGQWLEAFGVRVDSPTSIPTNREE